MRYEIHFIVEDIQELSFLLQDLFRSDCFVGDFVGHDLRMQRENVFVLGGEVHGSDADAVDVFILKNSALVLQPRQVLVENLNGQEVGPCGALERSANLHHPVSHFGSVLLGDLVACDWVWNGLIVLEA